MRTDELIRVLSSDGGLARPAGTGAAARTLGVALLFGAALSLSVLVGALGVRPDLGTALAAPVIWGKWGFALALVAAAFGVLQRLARPGARMSRWRGALLLLPIGAVWLAGLSSYAGAPSEARASLLWGQTWQACAALIALLSLPVFIATLLALRRLAPVRLALAGACAGLLAGAVAVAVYALHCPESGWPFIAVWYVAGIALPTFAGALLGRRLLRW